MSLIIDLLLEKLNENVHDIVTTFFSIPTLVIIIFVVVFVVFSFLMIINISDRVIKCHRDHGHVLMLGNFWWGSVGECIGAIGGPFLHNLSLVIYYI